MKWLGIILTVALLAGGPVNGNAQNQPQGSQAQVKPGQAAKSYTLEERQAYQSKAERDLEEIQQKVQDLKAKERTIVQQKKRTYLLAMVDIQRKLNAAKGKLAALKKASAKEWSRLQPEMDRALDDLTNAYNGVESHFN